MKKRILILDDHTQLYVGVKEYFSPKGYDVEFAGSNDISEKIDLLSFQLILLEIMSFAAGWDLCKSVRQATEVPILIVSTNSNVEDKVFGFSIGADDYVTKPFDRQELCARMDALLRRSGHVSQEEYPLPDIHFKDLVVHPTAREISVNGKRINSTSREFEVLYLLACYPNKVFRRDELVRQVWGKEFKGSVRTVDTHVKNIRAKLKKVGFDSTRIVTVWGVGYKFEIAKESVGVKQI